MNFFLAFLMSPFPKRYWGTAIGPGLLLSALLQSGLSLAGLMAAYEPYAKRAGQALADTTIATAVANEVERVEAEPAMALGAFTPLAFLAESTTGRLFAYGLLSGMFRVVGYAGDHACGDPVLTFLDDLVWGIGGSIKATLLGVASRLRSLLGG